MRTVKLKQAGESLTMTVAEVRLATSGNFPEVEFIGQTADGPTLVPMPKASADRQLDRLGETMASLTGKTITISRDPNKKDASKPFWGVNIEEGVPTTPKPAPVSQRVSQVAKTAPLAITGNAAYPPFEEEGPPVWDDASVIGEVDPDGRSGAASPSHEERFLALCRTHERCFEHAKNLGAKLGAQYLSGETVSALCAQLWIECHKRGIQL